MNRIIVLIFAFLISCSRHQGFENERDSAVKFFESSIGNINKTVRIFDHRRIRANPKERNEWIAFDASVKDWNKYVALNSLEEKIISGDPHALMGGYQEQLTSGFEGYLDGDFSRFRGRKKAGKICNYFVRNIRTYVRVVYVEIGY